MSTTKQEPALCTSAPVVGFRTPSTDRVTAMKFMHMEIVIAVLMVFLAATDKRFR